MILFMTGLILTYPGRKGNTANNAPPRPKRFDLPQGFVIECQSFHLTKGIEMNQAEKERAAKIGKRWTPKGYIKSEIEAIRRQVGDKKVLLAMSGGVDSSVCAVLLHKAIGKQLVCVFVDHGCMRKNEAKEVAKVFKGKFGINLIQIDAEERFLAKAKGIVDPELKRKCIGAEFINVFREEAAKLGKIEFLGQGTIYPDIVESGVGGHKAVKAHHNVGGLPKDIGFEGLVEPVKYLYKDEVCKVGRALGIPEAMVERQPFPGPGLAVRCLGELTKEKLDILREADYIFRSEMAKAKLDKKAQQFFAIMTNVKSVGVKKGAHVRLRSGPARRIHAAIRQGGSGGASFQVHDFRCRENRHQSRWREPRSLGYHSQASSHNRMGIIPPL